MKKKAEPIVDKNKTVDKKEKKESKKLVIKSWYSNRYQIILVQRNILLIIALLSVISMCFSIVFVKFIISTKSLEPYVIEVEEKTGVATVVEQLTSKSFTEDQVVRQYFINQFLQASTAYDPRTYIADVEKVRLMSVPEVYNDFRKRINVRDLGAESRIRVRVKSMGFPTEGSAQIRIDTITSTKGSGSKNKNEVVNINFKFSPRIKLTAEERMINPLGFQVTSYIKFEETSE